MNQLNLQHGENSGKNIFVGWIGDKRHVMSFGCNCEHFVNSCGNVFYHKPVFFGSRTWRETNTKFIFSFFICWYLWCCSNVLFISCMRALFCYFLATHPTVAVALLKCTVRLTSEIVDTARVQHLKVTRFNWKSKIIDSSFYISRIVSWPKPKSLACALTWTSRDQRTIARYMPIKTSMEIVVNYYTLLEYIIDIW